jgi:hypothetical protein
MAETRVVIPERIRALIATASTDGHPIVAGSVDPDGQPELAYYGSIQPFEAGRLVLWARPPAHVADRLSAYPKMSFLYWNRDERVMARLYGTARVVVEPDRRNAIFEVAPERERARDQERDGVAIEVELTRITGHVDGKPFTVD